VVNQVFTGCHGLGSDGWTYADIDGDGKAEYVTRTGGTHYVTRYTHVGLINQTFTGCAGNGGQGWSYADVDGDGRADYVTLGTGADTRMTVSRYNGTSCTTEAWIVPYPGAAGTTWVDVYGSGRSVLVSRGTDYVHVVTDALQVADKLTLMQNGLGAYTRITYAPSSGWANTFLPQGMILQAVTALSTSSGRDGASTANYRYEGGLWSSAERRFLGFRKATAVLDARGNYTEIYYHQHVGCVSKPETSYYRDAAGNLYSYASFTYEENAAAPYTSRLKQRWDYECNQTASCRRVVSQLDYDGYGNVVATYEWGDLDVGGDERTAYRGYYPNWGAYIVGLPAYENLYAGIGTGGPLAKQTLWEYDGAGTYAAAPTLGSISRKQLWDSSTGGYAISSYAYDAWGNVTRQTDAMGGVTTTTYDPLAHLYPTSTCDALGFCTTQTWDNALGAITAKTDPNGMTTSYTYDALGRPARKTLADGSWTQHEYLSWGDVWNQRSRETTADGSNAPPYRETFFDGLGRNYRTVRSGQAGGTCYDLCPSTCTDGCGYFYPCNVQCNPHPCYGVGTYQKDRIYSDASSRVWKESSWFTAGEAASWVVYAYDGAGRVQTVTNADGSVSQRSYGNGYAATYDELGAERVEWHDAYGRKIQIRERNGGSYAATTYRYDVLGNVVQSVDAAGSVSTFTWDSLSRKRSACDPDTGCHTYTPDALGRVLAQTDAKGQTVSATYDALGRVRTRGGATFVYDEAGHGASKGQLTTMIDGTGSESLSYDFRGQPTAQTKCVANICYTMQFGHDWLGRLATVTYPDGEVVTNRYDQAARVAGVSGYVSSLIYGANDQLLSAAFANGTTESFTYDPVRRWMTSAAVTGPSGATLYQASYAYEANGRVRQVTSTTNPLLNLTFGYDDLNRLLSVSGGQRQSFAYDAVGNMTYNSAIGGYTYGDAAHEHAVTAAGATGYSYDANGNMTAGAGRSLTWNADNQPLTVTKNGATTTYGYDGKGRRVSKVAPGSTSLYYGKFLELTNGSLVKYYYAGPVLVAKRDATGPSWYHQDHLGSVRALTNGAGLVINRYDYGAFGATVGASEGVANRFTFGGHRKDTENGLVFMNARYYDPDLGRFISADPIVPDPSNPQTLNRYSYANNNPISNVDPTGHGAVATIIVTVVVCVAAAWTGQWWVFALALVGGGCSVAGYYTNNPWLMSIGQVLLGAATGGWVGAVVAAMTSPVSPLDPKIKQAIGWAYMTYGLVNAAYEGYQQAESINGEPEAFADVEAGADEMTGPDGGSNAYEPGAGSAGSGDAASIVTQDAQKASMSTREWSIFDTRSASGAGDWSRPYDPSINYFGPEGTANLLWGHVPEWLNRLSYIHDAVLGADGFMVSNYVQAFVLDAMVGARGATGAAFTIARPPSEVFTIFSDLHVQ
jgi:RHS repeat-associated protein